MKTIGIKLADGSFYPVLEEFSNSEKQLDLTTAHNNQTKVMVDLYRSHNCSMDDAEYVDSLQIENLVAHPNGEPDISFTVSIDENNRLSAKIKDTETGNQSKTTITLVSRTIEERLQTDEYMISDSVVNDTKKSVPKTKKGGFLAMASRLRENEAQKNDDSAKQEEIIQNEESEDEENNNTVIGFTPAADDEIIKQNKLQLIDDVVLADTKDDVVWNDETEDDIIIEENETNDDIPIPEIITDTEKDFDEHSEEKDFSESEEVLTQNEAEINESDFDGSDFTSSDLSDINFDFPGDDSKEVLENAKTENDEDFQFSMDDEVDFEPENLKEQENFNKTKDFEENKNDEDFANLEMNENFDLNDMNSSNEEIFSEDEISFPDDNLSFDENFSLEDNLPSNEELAFDNKIEPFNDKSISHFDEINNNDKEEDKISSNEEEQIKKKTKVPVIICIICAIICVVATILVLFIVPSKYNLLTKHTEKTEQVDDNDLENIEVPETHIISENISETDEEKADDNIDEDNESIVESEQEPENEQEVESEPETEIIEAPAAQEEEIVIVEQAEIVVPEQPPVTIEKPKDINYKIKWGDTLWDIADTYYKNPWRYKYIARFNHIKDPDYIISGTYITIPAE